MSYSNKSSIDCKTLECAVFQIHYVIAIAFGNHICTAVNNDRKFISYKAFVCKQNWLIHIPGFIFICIYLWIYLIIFILAFL